MFPLTIPRENIETELQVAKQLIPPSILPQVHDKRNPRLFFFIRSSTKIALVMTKIQNRPFSKQGQRLDKYLQNTPIFVFSITSYLQRITNET